MSKKIETQSGINHDFEKFTKFVDEFKHESDRAAVILGAAKLDLLLYQLIKSHLLPCTSKSDDLLDGDSLLSTFSAKIMVAHRLGLIDDEFCRALHLIRKIRNAFAHEISGISLNSGAHSDRIRELVKPLSKHDSFVYLHETYFGDESAPATQFRTAIALASIRLEGAHNACNTSTSDLWKLLPQGYKRPSKAPTAEAM